jgi:hypothetical protein
MLALTLQAAIAAAEPGAAAVEVRRMPAAEAHQGVAADARSIYAIDNSQVARYDKASGRRVALWQGDPAKFKHLNSCIVRARSLVCAASNYPDVPMASMVVWLDAATLKLQRTLALKPGHGSLTWLDWHQGSWWAGFANYDGKGGEPGRDHRATVVVRYSPRFVETASYRFPDTVLDRFSPRSSSGGAWGRDGLLYVTGHDRPELYALRVPQGGGVLEHVATIGTPTGGQAIGWDPSDARLLWSIERRASEVVASRVPAVRPR